MNIVGLHAFTHDSACCLLRDGSLASYAEEERFSRLKHDAAFPERSLAYCLREAGIGLRDVERVAVAWAPFRGLWRRGAATFYNLRSPLRRARGQARKWLQLLAIPRRLAHRGFVGKVAYVDHYRAHASSAYFSSPFDDAAIMVVDGVGEVSTTSFWAGHGTSLKRLREIPYPHSLGLVYGAITEFLGYRINCDEGIVMGLSAYGTSRFLEDMRSIIRYEGGLSFRVDTRMFDFGGDWYTPQLVSRFGPPRSRHQEASQRDADLAYAVQRRLEEVVLAMAQELHRQTGLANLCLTGGVALNAALNGRLLHEGPYRDVFVLPASHDAGAALGAALSLAAPAKRVPFTPYVGPGFDEAAARRALQAAGLAFERPGRELYRLAAARLAAGAIVGWVHGRAEMGPRALGNRSILADPRRAQSRDRINGVIKRRESFRPLAPAVMLEHASRYFEVDRPLPHMLVVVKATSEGRQEVPAVVHVDGTARLQTVSPADNAELSALLGAFFEETGVPVLLNTSFNRAGEPMVLTPEDAVAAFLETDIDALAMEGLWVEKRPS